MKLDFSQIGAFLIAALFVFAIYRRLRRTFGQQLLSPIRMGIRIAVFVVISCLLLPIALRDGAFISAMLAGIALGVALAMFGAARTGFVRVASQLYYVPHTYTGIAVSLLFLGRLIYRVIQVYGNLHAGHAAAAAADQGFAPASMVRSPLTLGLFFVLMAYYVCYYSVVLWKSKRAVATEIIPDAAAASEQIEKRAESTRSSISG
jgi:hypothetical protein